MCVRLSVSVSFPVGLTRATYERRGLLWLTTEGLVHRGGKSNSKCDAADCTTFTARMQLPNILTPFYIAQYPVPREWFLPQSR